MTWHTAPAMVAQVTEPRVSVQVSSLVNHTVSPCQGENPAQAEVFIPL